MVKCMRCRKLLPESKMHKLMRYHEITPGANFNQMQIEFKYYLAHNIGKRFMGYMCDDCWVRKIKSNA
jgi:ribosomal protein S26